MHIHVYLLLDIHMIPNWINDLICCLGIRAASCMAILVCNFLVPGPASPAASDGLPLCSERNRCVAGKKKLAPTLCPAEPKFNLNQNRNKMGKQDFSILVQQAYITNIIFNTDI